jgi:hypothetical protein
VVTEGGVCGSLVGKTVGVDSSIVLIASAE